MKALIKVGYGCNDHCQFCHTLDVRDVQGEAAEVHRKIARAGALGHSMVVLSGGEPTIRPELLEWAAHVAKLDMDFGLVTNGRMLSYREMVDKLLARRMKYVYLSLHGGTPKVHNLLVRSQAFEQSYGALAQLTGRGLDLWVNCVVTQHNVDHLRDLVDAVLPYPDLTLVMSMVEAKGGGDKLFTQLTPRVAHVAERVQDAIDYGLAKVGRGDGPHFAHGALPLCLLGPHAGRYSDLKSHGYWTMTEVGEPDFFPVDDRNKVQPDDTCGTCSLSGPCPGLYRGYDAHFGSGELRPMRAEPRSNSCNYVYEAEQAMGEACPLLEDGVRPWDRGRHLFVREGARLHRYRTSTRDFSDRELVAIKLEAGQVYLDTSDKDAPDDFARDLAKLERSALCAPCPERDRCTGLFERVEADVFTGDDARVRALLSEMSGRLLDVGCGAGPYGDLFERQVREGALQYFGLDPDEQRVAELRQRWPWATVDVGRAEDLAEHNRGRADHAVVLRSWNHIEDPRRALGALVAVVAPGGTLLIVDNVAFGLARTRTQTERGQRSVARLEHYRNDSANEAHALARVLPLELMERQDVTPQRSNQWLLHYRRQA